MNDQFSITQRKQLERHRAWAKSRGIAAEKVRPQILKLYAPLVAGTDTYTFNTDINLPPVVSTAITVENRLKRDSLMFVNLIGLALHKVPIFTNVKYPHNSPLLFYPDKNIFADAAVAPGVVAEHQCLEAVYNGLLSFKTGQTVRLEDYPCNVFRSAPDTQNGAAAQPSQSIQLVDVNTSFYLSGSVDNRFDLRIGSASDRNGIAGGSESQNYAVLLLAGFEVMDGARALKQIETELGGGR
jgi:hypothetical protein